MTVTVDLTDTEIFAALRAVLLQLVPSGVEVVRGQTNRVPAPGAPDYVVMISIRRGRLATNIETWDQADPAPTTRTAMAPSEARIQCDVHGPAGADNAQIITTVLRSSYGYELFKAQGQPVAPLYVEDPKQTPFVSGEQQYEDRWSVDVVLQINPTITMPQDYADALSVRLVDVDATYPPGG